MSSDYKWDIQVRAEQIAEDEFNTDFYNLSEAWQMEVYARATREWSDGLAMKADWMRKARSENALLEAK